MDSDQRNRLEDELDDIPEKDLLFEVMIELKAIRHGLQTGDFGFTPDESSEEPQYRCKQCNDIVEPDKRTQHLVSKHNAPESIPAETEFSQV